MTQAVRLMIVTGAGASHAFGRNGPIPLMTDWATSLLDDLEAELAGSPKALGLTDDMSSQVFETAIGQFLQWQRAFALNERFQEFGSPQIGSRTGDVSAWLKAARNRSATVMAVLHDNLYRNFGRESIDDVAAGNAWQLLLQAVEGRAQELFFATTNYDPSLEVALEWLGARVADGFDRNLPRATPTFEREALGDWGVRAGGRLSVLHLHGAVGWYRSPDGRIVYHEPDQVYNRQQGTPVVLLPDPDKDPLTDPVLEGIWTAFERARGTATHILVVGHSLHDRALQQVLNRDGNTPIALITPAVGDHEKCSVVVTNSAAPRGASHLTTADPPLRADRGW